MTKTIGAGFAALLLISAQALAQVAPNLGSAAPFAVLGTNAIPTVGTVTCTDSGPGTAINGDVGSTFNLITNTGCTINGTVTAPVAAQVVNDFNAAFASIDGLNPCTGVIPTTTTTLNPGVFCSPAGTTIGAGVIITLRGNVNDVFVFRVGTGGLGALTVTDAQIVLSGGARACNVFFKTAEGTTLTRSAVVGTFLAGTAFTMTNGSLIGRALASTDATVTNAAPLTFGGCAAAPPGPVSVPTLVPTLSEWAMILLAMLMATAGIAAMRRRTR
ncbi:MAG: IPTL-CTERM sorting domain-containing protein [Pseudomonadota bacterium]|nr:IPTL-CTERM sorting domain-containing protein [Pseudomonadota bacterium]